MVRIKGPLTSADARGSFGPTAIFSSWKGRSYAKSKTIPTNPNTPLQISVRAMLGFLAGQWNDLTAPNKATWDELAAQTNIPPYNAFIAHNLTRWEQFHAPSTTYPATETGTQATAFIESATGGAGHVDLAIACDPPADGWGLILFRSPTVAFTSSRQNAIHIFQTQAIALTYYTDSNLTPGTYYYRTRRFTTTGKLATQSFTTSAIVT